MKVEDKTSRPAFEPRSLLIIASGSFPARRIGCSIRTSKGSPLVFGAVISQLHIVIVGIEVHRHVTVVDIN